MLIFHSGLFRYCPKTSVDFRKNIAGNTFQDRSFSRKFFWQLIAPLLDKINTNTDTESCTLKYSQFFFLKIIRVTKYSSYTLEKKYLWKSWKLLLSSMSTFCQGFSNVHFPSQCLFLERAVDFTIYLYYNKHVGSTFFIKFSFQNQFAGGFS